MLVLHDDALLTRYGVRADQAGDPDTEGWWIVETTTDYAAKAVAEWEADNETGPGETVTVRLDPDYIPRHRGDRRR